MADGDGSRPATSSDEPLPEGVLVLGVVIFYVPVGVGAAGWIAWRHGAEVLWARLLGDSPVLDVAIGVAVGLAVVGGVLLARRLGWTAGMERGLARVLGHPSTGAAFVVALLSGAVEELLFRGTLQPAIGPVWATLIFALVHLPLDRDLKWWPLFALAVGAVLAALYELTGAVLAPAIAHFTVNLLDLRMLRKDPAPP